MIRCGARVRKLCITQMLAPSPLEVQLLRRVLSMSEGTTLLPALLSLSWVESPRTNGLLLRLIPNSLQELELILDTKTSPKQVHSLFTGLSHPALSLHSLRIYSWKPELFQLESALRVTSLREISLKGGIVLCPEDFCKILSALPLFSIEADIRNFTPWTKAIDGRSLKGLHCTGSCADLTALISRLGAPNLNTADLKLDNLNGHLDRREHHQLSQVLLKFSSSLRTLQLEYRIVFDDSGLQTVSLTPCHALPPVDLVSDVLAPLFGFGRLDLENFTLSSNLRILLTDDHILRLAQGWPQLRTLSLMSHPCEPLNSSTPSSLVHLAKHCPNLRFLRLKINAREFVPPEPGSEESLALLALGHPLRILRQMNGYDACQLGGWPMAEFLDALFPHLDVDRCCEETGTCFIHERRCSWVNTWDALRAIQKTRQNGRALKLEGR